MTERRWWHVAILGIGTLLTVLCLASARNVPVGLGTVAAIVLGWFLFGRLESWLARSAYIAVLIAASATGTAVEPSFAIAQCVVFPLLWTLSENRRQGIILSLIASLSIGVGMYVSTGSLLQAVAIEAISLAISIALGLWITAIARTSDERKRLLDELGAAQERVRMLDREAGVATERERLAREIHDTIAQDLTGLVLLSQRAQRELGAHETLTLLEENARTALAETRALVAASSPVALDGGIIDALDRLAARFTRETGIEVAVRSELPALDRDTEVVLLRCAQEGLANVRKHSGASRVELGTWTGEGSVALRVADDGSGFDTEAATDGFGLRGLRDRLALVGGTLDIASSPAGTVLTATLPASA